MNQIYSQRHNTNALQAAFFSKESIRTNLNDLKLIIQNPNLKLADRDIVYNYINNNMSKFRAI